MRFGIIFHLLLIQIIGSSARSHRWLDRCRKSLGMGSGLIRDEDITASSSLDPVHLGPANARIHTELKGGAWCPLHPVSSDVHEYLDINLGSLKVITMIETQGRFGNGQDNVFTEQYKILYQREDRGKWFTFKNRRKQEVFQGNSNAYGAELRQIDPVIIARRVRVLPFSVHPKHVCLRLELYGCAWNDSSVEYSIPVTSGQFSGSRFSLTDLTYDGGSVAPGRLEGGLGLLVDGLEGRAYTDLQHDSDLGDGWVGWSNSTLGEGWVDIWLRFDSVRNFSSVELHCNNQFSRSVRLLRRAEIRATLTRPDPASFTPQIIYKPVRDSSSERDRWVKIGLGQEMGQETGPDMDQELGQGLGQEMGQGLGQGLGECVGRFLWLRLYLDDVWIALSEIRVHSELAIFTDPVIQINQKLSHQGISDLSSRNNLNRKTEDVMIPDVMNRDALLSREVMNRDVIQSRDVINRDTINRDALQSRDVINRDVINRDVINREIMESLLDKSVKVTSDKHQKRIDDAGFLQSHNNSQEFSPVISPVLISSSGSSRKLTRLSDSHIGMIIGSLSTLTLILLAVALSLALICRRHGAGKYRYNKNRYHGSRYPSNSYLDSCCYVDKPAQRPVSLAGIQNVYSGLIADRSQANCSDKSIESELICDSTLQQSSTVYNFVSHVTDSQSRCANNKVSCMENRNAAFKDTDDDDNDDDDYDVGMALKRIGSQRETFISTPICGRDSHQGCPTQSTPIKHEPFLPQPSQSRSNSSKRKNSLNHQKHKNSRSGLEDCLQSAENIYKFDDVAVDKNIEEFQYMVAAINKLNQGHQDRDSGLDINQGTSSSISNCNRTSSSSYSSACSANSADKRCDSAFSSNPLLLADHTKHEWFDHKGLKRTKERRSSSSCSTPHSDFSRAEYCERIGKKRTQSRVKSSGSNAGVRSDGREIEREMKRESNGGEREIERDSLRFLERLGSGQYGQVYLCEMRSKVDDVTDNTSSNLVVAQVFTQHSVEVCRQLLKTRAEYLNGLKHKNIVSLIGVCSLGSPYCLIEEYLKYGRLDKFLQRSQISQQQNINGNIEGYSLNFDSLLYILSQICSAMRYLESRTICLGCLRASSCLVGEQLLVKLSSSCVHSLESQASSCEDVNNKKQLQKNFSTQEEIRWMSWEAVTMGQISSKGDVWSFGMTMLEVLSLAKVQPFDELEIEEVFTNHVLFHEQWKKDLSISRTDSACHKSDQIRSQNTSQLHCSRICGINNISSPASEACRTRTEQLNTKPADTYLKSERPRRVSHHGSYSSLNHDNFHSLPSQHSGLDLHSLSTHRVPVLPSRPEYCTRDLMLLMLQCWQLDPHRRPNFTDIEIFLNQNLLENQQNSALKSDYHHSIKYSILI